MTFSPPFIGLALFVLLAGCAEQTATVTGTVTLDGEPLAVTRTQWGTIIFHPADGGAVATGVIDHDGTYRVSTGQSEEVQPGRYRVTVRLVDVLPATELSAEPTGRPLTPAVYANAATSGLEFLVTPGENQFDLKLRSDAGPAIPADSALRDAEPDEPDVDAADAVDAQEESTEE